MSVYMRWGLAVAWVATALTRAETPLLETRSTLQKWVETRQLISKTKGDWQSDKEMLQQTAELLDRELKAVNEQFQKLGTNSTQVDKERLQAEALLQSSTEGLDRAKQFATSFEARIQQVIPSFPGPLQEILKPLLNRLPADPVATKMLPTERMQVIVGIRNEVDKFNSGGSGLSEKTRNSKGEEVAVDTIYVGLGAAYFVNEAGDFAGVGSTGEKGWAWTPKPEIASSVREIIRIYRNEVGARFVSLPVVIR